MTDRTVIRQAMAMLSNPHRAMIYRAYYLERSTAQIAAEYATTEHVVRAELHDAMQALRRILRDVHAAVLSDQSSLRTDLSSFFSAASSCSRERRASSSSS